MTTQDENAIPDIRYLAKKHGFRAWVHSSSDTYPDESNVDDPYLVGVVELLKEAINDLGSFKLVLLMGDDFMPREQPPGTCAVNGVVYEGGGSEWAPTSHYLPTQTDWSEVRAAARAVMLRALWSHGLMRFCAAMPRPTGRNRKSFGARHTTLWLAESEPDIEDDFKKYWAVRNTQIAHAGKDSSPRGGTAAPFRVLTHDLVLRWIDATLPDSDLRFSPEPEDADRLLELVQDAMAFTIFRLQEKSKVNPDPP